MKLFDLIKNLFLSSNEKTHESPQVQEKYRRETIKSSGVKTVAEERPFDVLEKREPPKVQERYKSEIIRPSKVIDSTTKKTRHHAERKNIVFPKKANRKELLLELTLERVLPRCSVVSQITGNSPFNLKRIIPKDIICLQYYSIPPKTTLCH